MRTGRIFTLIAGYRDDPREIARVAREGLELGPVLVVVDELDFTRDLLSRLTDPGVVLTQGRFSREADKRSFMLRQLELEFDVATADWILSLDPDEKLLHGDVLPLHLDRVPDELPAYPIPRIEPDGRLWLMPCKLFRGTAIDYVQLDVGVKFAGERGVWNLDPWQFELHDGDVVAMPGWPQIAHFRSPRADWPTDGFYDQPVPTIPYTHVYKEELARGHFNR